MVAVASEALCGRERRGGPVVKTKRAAGKLAGGHDHERHSGGRPLRVGALRR
jgi:hypothetical protein